MELTAPRARSEGGDLVVYQVYPRSFQDSDGDGIGDLEGITSRLDHLRWLGVDALWLSPIYPSPMADGGYDVADHCAVDPLYGDLGDLDRLIEECHARGLRFLLDLVPSHTSIEHPWFREHPDWYVWADDGPPNNWVAAFGGRAWSRDEASGRWYLHSFYPEQPDLDWRNPEVRAAIGEVIRFWRDRGVDGFRVDAVQNLMKHADLHDDPVAEAPYPLPLHPELAVFDPVHSRTDPEIVLALAAIREAAGDALLVGEAYVPNRDLDLYLEYFDLVFAFEFLHAPWDAAELRAAIEPAARLSGASWVISNHDFPRLASRIGPEAARAAAVLLLTLPGTAFLYQGDEIGMVDGPGASPPFDRAGRDPHRHPMQWTPDQSGGFTSGRPWLPLTDPSVRSVEAQLADPGSILHLHRELIALRPRLGGAFSFVDGPPGLLAFRRGGTAVLVNVGERPLDPPLEGNLVLSTVHGSSGSGPLRPGEGRVLDVADPREV